MFMRKQHDGPREPRVVGDAVRAWILCAALLAAGCVGESTGDVKTSATDVSEPSSSTAETTPSAPAPQEESSPSSSSSQTDASQQETSDSPSQTEEEPSAPASNVSETLPEQNDTSLFDSVVEPPTDPIRIASFNIRIFGPSKAGKADIMAELATIIREYDLVVVQEIKDSKENVPWDFLSEINSDGSSYGLVLSPRTGLNPDDRWSREQYGFYYDTETMHPIDAGALYDDIEDQFQREPYAVPFATLTDDLTFVIAAIHTKPDAAVEEIAALHDVHQWMKATWPWEDDAVILGDYNAGCSYASTAELDALDLRGPEYVWVVPDDADTNVASSTCAYDRIVLDSDLAEAWTGDWAVDSGMDDRDVSDHHPIWFSLNRTDDTVIPETAWVSRGFASGPAPSELLVGEPMGIAAALALLGLSLVVSRRPRNA